MSQKYTSYTSKTNLYSEAFFNNSIVTTAVSASAEAASMVSATGRSTSDIQILAAKAATKASYSVNASALGLTTPGMSTSAVTTTSASPVTLGTLKGSFTLNYDGQSIEISFDETDLIDNRSSPAAGSMTLKDAIEKKLQDVTINTSKNGPMKASDLIDVDVVTVGANDVGRISFSEKSGPNAQGASPYISYIDNSLKSDLGVTESKLYEGSNTKKYTLANVQTSLTETQSLKDYLGGRTINVTLDGVNKSFELDGSKLQLDTDGAITMDSLAEAFEAGFKKIGAKVDVTVDGDKLNFALQNETSTISISAADEKVNDLLGLSGGVGNYISEKSSLSSLLGSGFFDPAKAATVDPANTTLKAVTEGGKIYEDNNGNRYEMVHNDTENTDAYYRIDSAGDRLFELTINEKSVYVSAKSSLESVLSQINDSDMGVTAAYSKLTGSFTLTAKEAGSTGSIEFGAGLAESLFAPKTSGVTLGDVLNDDWFDANGNLNMYIGTAAGNFNATPRATNLNKNSSVADFLKQFNAGTASIQFADSSSVLSSNGRNSGDTFSGYNLTVKATSATTHSDTWAENYRISSATAGAPAMSLKEFADAVNQVVESRNAVANANNEGKDAQIRVLVNGEAKTLTRSSNSINLDGMTVNLKGDIGDMSAYDRANAAAIAQLDKDNKADAVSFTTSGGSEDIIKTITEFVDEYNSALKQVYEAFATQPAEKSSSTHAKYEPLTDDDKSSMSEKAIENYEAKAKQGILFGDSDLRGLYQQLVNAVSPNGSDGAALRSMGIDVTYSSGLTQIKLNESALREALESDPDKVRNAFTKSKANGATSDGLMSSIKQTMEQYASTSIASPGILVQKAGSTFSSTSLLSNAVQTQIDSVQTEIEKWQTKMSAKIDYYTRQFTALEKLMNTMNSQSSALSGLMGGY